MSLTVLILTHNEEIHLARCLDSLRTVADKIVIVDSFSDDRTLEIAADYGAQVYQRAWKNYADQFQWGLAQCADDSGWIMRMDADEYLEPDLIAEIQATLPNLAPEIQGIYLKRKVFFMGKWIRYGGFYPHILLRIWRNGQGRIEQRWMDEHIVLHDGAQTVMLGENMVDDNHKGITFWINKHNRYATREMVDLLNIKYGLTATDDTLRAMQTSQAGTKRLLKERVYARMPGTLRALLYFGYRYILRFGFLDGGRGFIWHFMQGFWYRLLVDIKVMEVENRCQGDAALMKTVLKSDYGIEL